MASCRTRVRSRRRGSARHLAKVRFTKVSGRFFANSEMANPRRGIRVKFTVTYVAEWHWRMRAHVDAWKLDQTGILRVRHVVDASIDLPVPVLCILGIVSQSTAQKELSRLSAHVRVMFSKRARFPWILMRGPDPYRIVHGCPDWGEPWANRGRRVRQNHDSHVTSKKYAL